MKIYQVLVVSRAVGFNFIIPDAYAYKTYSDAMADFCARKNLFEDNGEVLNFCGKITSIADIQKIYAEQDLVNDTNDGYIYEIELR